MEIESYYEFVSKEKQENPLAELTGPIAVNLKEVVIESAHQPTLFPYSDGIEGHTCQI
jgi:hypothetical protein